MILLAIESSCDETSAAIMVDGELKSNVISTQLIHSEWGGVVPELASRAHQKSIIPVVQEALQKANINKNDLNAITLQPLAQPSLHAENKDVDQPRYHG
jgi:N6-L-threonylcarbamoyladenine synthase